MMMRLILGRLREMQAESDRSGRISDSPFLLVPVFLFTVAVCVMLIIGLVV